MLYESTAAILAFFVAHWVLSVFSQTFFLHRYAAHRMFRMNRAWEGFFYLFTWFTQGSSFLVPRAYAILHREHHAYSDTEKDPHSPEIHGSLARMMWATKQRYSGLVRRTIECEDRFVGGYPEWSGVDALANTWTSRIAFGTGYTLFYLAFAPHWVLFLLLPIHYLMGPIHGAIVNWCGHKYGYRNFSKQNDRSQNTLFVDFLTLGELFQNNHHRYGMAPNFAVRWFELDPAWCVIWILHKVRIVRIESNRQRMYWPGRAVHS
jgi:stearoyl-CoA desaturase (delta-9 desaturase)